MNTDNTTKGPNQRQIFSVSQLNRRVRQLLETQFPLLWVEGEISNFSCPSSGHWYFTLKDDLAQVRCAMFRGSNSRVLFRPEHGMQVLIRCRVGLYENRGDFQLIAEHMEEAGHGALQRQFEALKVQLAAEGLFDDAHKRKLPWLPKRIGVITSPTGAAIEDILNVLKRRFPAIPVSVYPCAVQGAAAAGQIVQAIAEANNRGRCEVLIVGRGGGSLADLWAFNEESVARAIHASEIPIVSAVGHETDFTIADFVADVRAPTPSAAAELVSPDTIEFQARFSMLEKQLKQAVLRKLHNQQQQLDLLSQRLRHPGERIRQQQQQLMHTTARLNQVFSMQLHLRHHQLSQLGARLNRHHPGERLKQSQQLTIALQQRLNRAVKQLFLQKRSRWQATAQLLNSVSPLQTLERGYAIISDENRQIIRKVASVNPGDKITARISDGTMRCHVEKITLE